MKFDGKVYTHSTLEEGYDFFITDRWKKRRHFKISTFPHAGGLLSEAIEVVSGKNDEPYIFSIFSPFDADEEYAELTLKAKIKKGINKRYLERKDGRLFIGKNNEVIGRIIWDDNSSEYGMALFVDGKRISIQEFGRMLNSYEGWQFKFQILDRIEE